MAECGPFAVILNQYLLFYSFPDKAPFYMAIAPDINKEPLFRRLFFITGVGSRTLKHFR